MGSYYLSQILPSQRNNFLTLMAVHGVTGENKPTGRVNSVDRVSSSLDSNLLYKLPAKVTLSPGRGYDRVLDDPIDDAVSAAIAPKIFDRKRLDEYHTLYRATLRDAVYTKTSGSKRRLIYGCNYSNIVKIADVESEAAFNNWVKHNFYDDNYDAYAKTVPVYIHGLLIEGINFSQDVKSNIIETQFTELTKIEPPKRPRPTYNRYGRRSYTTAPIESTVPKLKLERYGYIKIGRFVITSFPDHATWLASQPEVTISEDELLNKWRGAILGSVSKERDTISLKLEKLQSQVIEEERKFGQLSLLIDSAQESTNKAIRDNIEKLRAIPELEALTLTSFGFSIITKDMMATRQKTGDERYCGKFEIQIGFKGSTRVRNIASPMNGYRNPHGNCVGSFGSLFASALRTFDYYALILTIMEYYRMVDKQYDHKWEYLPNSKTAPNKVYISEWQEIAGTWNYDTENKNALEEHLFGEHPADQDEYEEEDA